MQASSPRALSSALLVALSLSTACASHSAKTLEARAALDAGKPKKARDLLNKALKVKSAKELPTKNRDDDALLVLDRSMVSQQLDDYESSSQDLQFADKAVEMLDLSRTAVDDIGKYIFSDDSGPYRGAPYEKVMINTMNMVNYLARHDLSGAKIEARRLSIIQKYLREKKNPAVSMNAPGGYLAGFVFEHAGDANIALRYYGEALAHTEFLSLLEPVKRLTGPGSYSNSTLKKFLAHHAKEEPLSPEDATTEASSNEGKEAAPPPETSSEEETPLLPVEESAPTKVQKVEAKLGELLVVINYGRVPAKIDKRIPIGLALTYASLFMSAASRSSANRLAAQGLVTWINYPDLEESKRKLRVPHLKIDGKAYALEGAVAVDITARKAYEKERGAIIASAITRMIARVIAGQTAGAAASAASNDSLVGALVSLGTQAALVAADTPDTRSWSTLPARMAVARVRLPAGRYKVELSAQGLKKTYTIDLVAGGWDTAVLTVLR